MGYLVVAILSLFVGGYGGYAWGRSVEAKAQAVASALKQSAVSIDTAVKK
jgi:hypothetical protein